MQPFLRFNKCKYKTLSIEKISVSLNRLMLTTRQEKLTNIAQHTID